MGLISPGIADQDLVVVQELMRTVRRRSLDNLDQLSAYNTFLLLVYCLFEEPMICISYSGMSGGESLASIDHRCRGSHPCIDCRAAHPPVENRRPGGRLCSAWRRRTLGHVGRRTIQQKTIPDVPRP